MALNDPDKDDALKAALRENFEMSSGGALTNEDLERLETQYEWLCREMAEGHIQVSIEEFSDGVIDDRKQIHVRRLTTEDENHEESDNAEKAVSSLLSPDEEKAEANKSLRGISSLIIERFKAYAMENRKFKGIEAFVEAFKVLDTKSHMVPSLLERYSEAEMGERIERYSEHVRECMYELFYPTTHSAGDIGFTDEELAELNEKLSANQIPLSEQEKAVEAFAKRLTPADRANVTRIESGDFTTLPDMPESESQQ